MMTKDKLIFDIASADSGDNVGSFLRSSAGELITSTTVGEKQGLDVNVLNEITTHNVDPLRFSLDGSTVVVSEDTSTPANSKPLPVKLMGTAGPINITAGDLNVQLSASNDSVKIGDGTNFLALTSAGEVQTITRANSNFKTTAPTVTSSAALLTATSLSNRKWVEIQNLGQQDIYIGDSSVTPGTGLRIARGAYWKGEIGPGVPLYAVSQSGASAVRFIEVA